MIEINGKVVAENNDPNTVLSLQRDLVEGKLIYFMRQVVADMVYQDLLTDETPANNKRIQTDGTSAGTPYIYQYGTVALSTVKTKPNTYLCTDVNGNLIFKEL